MVMDTLSRKGCISIISRQFSSITGRPLNLKYKQNHDIIRNRDNLQIVNGGKKGKKTMRMKMRPQESMLPPTPPIDPKNEEFIMFVRSKILPQWIPYTIMKGGWQANALAKSQQTEFGRKFSHDTMVKSICTAFYKDIKKIEKNIRKNIPMLKQAKELEYGFKIRDKSNPDDWWKAENVELLPPVDEIDTKSVVDKVKDFFSGKK